MATCTAKLRTSVASVCSPHACRFLRPALSRLRRPDSRRWVAPRRPLPRAAGAAWLRRAILVYSPRGRPGDLGVRLRGQVVPALRWNAIAERRTGLESPRASVMGITLPRVGCVSGATASHMSSGISPTAWRVIRSRWRRVRIAERHWRSSSQRMNAHAPAPGLHCRSGRRRGPSARSTAGGRGCRLTAR